MYAYVGANLNTEKTHFSEFSHHATLAVHFLFRASTTHYIIWGLVSVAQHVIGETAWPFMCVSE